MTELMSYIAGRNFTSELREGRGRNKGSVGDSKENLLTAHDKQLPAVVHSM